MRLIDADALSAKMYHEAFETDTDFQRWDSGCWIRYKMFENALKDAPTIEPEQRWIPCCERLPDEGNTTYMTTVDYGELGRGTGQRFFYGKTIGWEDDAVVAWMPLPEPYIGDAE